MQEQNCEALEAVTRLGYKCTAVGCMRVDKHQSATKNTFTKWKAAATLVPQPKDDSHANCKSTLTGPACSKSTKANQDVKKKVTLGFILLSREFLKGKTSEKMFTLGLFY